MTERPEIPDQILACDPVALIHDRPTVADIIEGMVRQAEALLWRAPGLG